MINVIERQTELGKSLFQINTSTMKELATLQRENLENYFQTNREFGDRLPEVKSVSDFVSLQREYNQTLWNNAKVAVESQTEIVKSAFAESTSAVKAAFATETATETPAPKAKAKPRAKAKKPAKES